MPFQGGRRRGQACRGDKERGGDKGHVGGENQLRGRAGESPENPLIKGEKSEKKAATLRKSIWKLRKTMGWGPSIQYWEGENLAQRGRFDARKKKGNIQMKTGMKTEEGEEITVFVT